VNRGSESSSPSRDLDIDVKVGPHVTVASAVLSAMLITPDGQLTIPPEICEQLGISAETELEFEVESNRLYIQKKPASHSMADWIATASGTLQHLTTDQIMALTRDDEIL
jgi:bifunctional DNA-binding transcriptional regulator/antitoxin component of YhaV-PrlF toxin-antitoxin module